MFLEFARRSAPEGIGVRITCLLALTLAVFLAFSNPAFAQGQGNGDGQGQKQGQDGDRGANNNDGPFDENENQGDPSENGQGDGNANGRPCQGCVGNADDKNPPGQGRNDANKGYECDENRGVGVGNPAHSGCGDDDNGGSSNGGGGNNGNNGNNGSSGVAGVTGSNAPGSGVLGDSDRDGVPDRQEDSDGDGIPDAQEGRNAAHRVSLASTGLNAFQLTALAAGLLLAGFGLRRALRGHA
jgi:hypothetical protein